jgi:N6-adenosine-specific RNA methylase IME4
MKRKKYSAVVADCPWSFGDKLGKRGAEANYSSMSVEELCGMARGPFTHTMQISPLRDVRALALCGKKFRLADDCLLFFWKVAAMPEEALDVVAAWGFEPKSEIVWIKTSSAKSNGLPPTSLPYNGRPGFAAGVDTSEEAADAIASEVDRLRATVLELIVNRGKKGHTADEIVSAMGVRHHTGSPRVTELHQMGLIVDSGKRRPTRSGKAAIVWIKAPAGTPARPPKGKGFKLHFGMGRYVRNCHETCLIAARGSAARLIESHSIRSVFFAPIPRDEAGKIIHSAKPDAFYSIVEELVGEKARKLELFARRRRDGWKTVGNEVK